MIRVDRASVTEPSVLKSKKATAEQRRANEFYAPFVAASTPAVKGKKKTTGQLKSAAKRQAEKTPKTQEKDKKKKFNFAMYKDDEVKALLHRMFRGKCAYCEARYIATQPMDVEHFRPKSEVTDFDGSKRVGYYWLAAEWTNLLPSCIDCNRPRNHIENGKPVRLGKDTLFPLAANSPRAAFGGSIDAERPLLLDPCRDRPEQYLVYTEGIAGPSMGPTAPPDADERVKASLRVYGLNRIDLVQERYQVLLNVRKHFHQLRALTVALAMAQTAEPARVRDLLVRSLGDLISYETSAILSMADATQPFSLMVNQEIAAFEAEIGRGLG